MYGNNQQLQRLKEIPYLRANVGAEAHLVVYFIYIYNSIIASIENFYE
jgi:hypothetical protein